MATERTDSKDGNSPPARDLAVSRRAGWTKLNNGQIERNLRKDAKSSCGKRPVARGLGNGRGERVCLMKALAIRRATLESTTAAIW